MRKRERAVVQTFRRVCDVEAELRAGRKTVRHMEALLLVSPHHDDVLAATWAKVKRYE